MIDRDYPVIAPSLQLAASAQLRNMASLGGNVLQRTLHLGGTDASARLYACPNVGSQVTVVHADRNTPGFMR